MGFGGVGPGSLILIAVIVLLLFGTKKLRNIGGDLGSAIKGFKKAMNDEKDSTAKTDADSLADKSTVASDLDKTEEKKENSQV